MEINDAAHALELAGFDPVNDKLCSLTKSDRILIASKYAEFLIAGDWEQRQSLHDLYVDALYVDDLLCNIVNDHALIRERVIDFIIALMQNRESEILQIMRLKYE